MEQFDQLLDCSADPNPLLETENARLRAEYSTFVTNVNKASDILKRDKVKYTQTDLWYLLLTREEFYVYCEYFIAFTVKFLNRSFNEAIVESEVSSLEDNKTPSRPRNICKIEFHINKWSSSIGQSSPSKRLSNSTFR